MWRYLSTRLELLQLCKPILHFEPNVLDIEFIEEKQPCFNKISGSESLDTICKPAILTSEVPIEMDGKNARFHWLPCFSA
jgi:hypothetical protein